MLVRNSLDQLTVQEHRFEIISLLVTGDAHIFALGFAHHQGVISSPTPRIMSRMFGTVLTQWAPVCMAANAQALVKLLALLLQHHAAPRICAALDPLSLAYHLHDFSYGFRNLH